MRIDATHECDLVERPTVVRTTRIEYENKSAATDWTIAVAGVGLVGLGVVTIADAHSVDGTSKTGSSYNPLGQGGAMALGIASAVIGAATVAVPVLDAVHANRVDVTKGETTLDDVPLRTRISCSNSPLVGGAVTTQSGKDVFALGQTDSAGQLSSNLDEKIPAEWTVPAEVTTMPLLVDGVALGAVDPNPLFRVREARAFPKDAAASCSSPTKSTDCDAFKAFLTRYPTGEHAAEAQRMIDRAAPQLHRLLDEESWQKTKDSAEACASKNVQKVSEIDDFCDFVQHYVSAYPDGQHVEEANEAIKVGRAHSAALTAEAARKQAAVEAEERRRAAAASAQAKSDCLRLIQAGCDRVARRQGIPMDICIRRAMEAQNQCNQ